MKFASGIRKKGRADRGARRAGVNAAEAVSVAAQMALLCPSGMDVWMQRELSGCTDLDRLGSAKAG